MYSPTTRCRPGSPSALSIKLPPLIATTRASNTNKSPNDGRSQHVQPATDEGRGTENDPSASKGRD